MSFNTSIGERICLSPMVMLPVKDCRWKDMYFWIVAMGDFAATWFNIDFDWIYGYIEPIHLDTTIQGKEIVPKRCHHWSNNISFGSNEHKKFKGIIQSSFNSVLIAIETNIPLGLRLFYAFIWWSHKIKWPYHHEYDYYSATIVLK